MSPRRDSSAATRYSPVCATSLLLRPVAIVVFVLSHTIWENSRQLEKQGPSLKNKSFTKVYVAKSFGGFRYRLTVAGRLILKTVSKFPNRMREYISARGSDLHADRMVAAEGFEPPTKGL